MSSVRRAPHTAPATAERIRDAAIATFAAHGFAKSTVRAIAAAADVSPGLVIHHFGSKERLRAACDDHVFEVLTRTKREYVARSPFLVAEMFRDEPTRAYAEYLLASLLDPSGPGQRFFDHYVEVVERAIAEGFEGYVFRPADDRRAQATAVAMLGLAPMLLEPRIRGSLGTDDLPASIARLAPSLYDLYLHGLIERVPATRAPHPREDKP